jgi:hypothetical protein
MLGTVGYMAPEQAMGSREADARADVFALGCVLFECLTGKPTFGGDHAVAVLAKVLMEEAPRVSEHRPGIHPGLDELVARMLAKKAEHRPADAGAVLQALDAFDNPGRPASLSPDAAGPHSLGYAEQRLVSVSLSEPAEEGAVAATATPEQATGEAEAAGAAAARFGADLHVLSGGVLAFVLTGKGTASDLAARAAGLALAVARALPSLRLAVATGRAETTGRLPVGLAIDRAAALLRAPAAPSTGPLLDTVTTELVGARCIVREEGAFRVLVSEADDVARPRLLMGKPTPTVGREKELALLEATLAECIDDSVARMVIVTAPPGTGKSRLGSEFLSRVRRADRARVLVARGEATGGASLVRDLVWRAAGLREDDGPAERMEAWRRYAGALLRGPDGALTAGFLGEAIGLPAAGRPTPELVAARNDPRIMASRVRQATAAWFDAESARGQLVFVLEDLHWADAGGVAHLGESLARLAERPMFILALARPEMREAFPKLWERPGTQEIKLEGLTRRASERLAQAALGDTAGSTAIARLVDRAGGNAFYLEELVRAAAEGRDDFPETVTAMAASRLERLEPDARRVLRAASIFGEQFPTAGIVSVLGGDTTVPVFLESLAAREVIDRAAEGRFARETEWAFRHALLRDAAYGMLTEADRVSGHAMVGAWLSGREESEPVVVGEHFEKGGMTEKAAEWFMRAVMDAVYGVSLTDPRKLERAFTAEVTGTDRGRLRAAQAYFGVATLDLPIIIQAAEEAMNLLPVGDPLWFLAAGALMLASVSAGNPSLGAGVIQSILAFDATPPALGPVGWCLMNVTAGLLSFDQGNLAALVHGRMHAAASAERDETDPAFLGFEAITRSIVSSRLADDAAGALRAMGPARQHFERSGNTSGIAHALFFTGVAHSDAGDLEAARPFIDASCNASEAAGSAYGLSLARSCSRLVSSVQGIAGTEDVLVDAAVGEDLLTSGLAAICQADHHLRQQNPQQAALCLPPVNDIEVASLPWDRGPMYALHARVLLALGDTAEAVSLAERAAVGSEKSAMTPYWRSLVLLTHAECLHSAGRIAEAHAAIRRALDRLIRNAAGFEDEVARKRYLTNLPHNRRTMELARDWLRDS